MARTAGRRLALDAPEHAGTLKGAAGRKHCIEPRPASGLDLGRGLDPELDLEPAPDRDLDLDLGFDLGLGLGSPIALAPRRRSIHG